MGTELVAVLTQARDLGFLGPGPVEDHIDHAGGFLRAVPSPPERAVDLGSGGGVPGLVLATWWPKSVWILLDASERRTAFLATACATLGLEGRVQVLRARAEDVGRGPLRGAADLVVARGFGPPAVTAECAAPLLRVGGRLAVSEPPTPLSVRWPAAGMAVLELEEVEDGSTGAIRVHRLIAPCPDRYPRRTGVPAKRPLF